MLRQIPLLATGLLLSACSQEEPKSAVPAVDLHGRLVVDQEMTASRQAQGIQGEYYKRVLSVNGQDMAFADFVKQHCPNPNTRDETCQKAFRIKKIDDVVAPPSSYPTGFDAAPLD